MKKRAKQLLDTYGREAIERELARRKEVQKQQQRAYSKANKKRRTGG